MGNMITSQKSLEAIQEPARRARRAAAVNGSSFAPWPEAASGSFQLALESEPGPRWAANSRAFQHQLALLQFLLDASPQGMMLTDQEGNLVLGNDSLLRLFSLTGSLDGEQGRDWAECLALQGQMPERLYRVFHQVLREKNSETLDVLALKNGRLLECRTRYRMVEQLGENYRLWEFRDCTEQYRRETDLQHLSMHDPLTGLHNRAFFELQLGRLRKSRQFPLAMIMLDVDGLKMVNDSRGHLAGDTLLCQVAQILRQACRKEDVIARLGGDEFALVLAQANAGVAEHIIDRIQGLLNLHNIRTPALPISLSMGCAVAQDEYEMETLAARADGAMYRIRRERRAKAASRLSPGY